MGVTDDIKGRLDIVEVVSGYLTLQKAGRNFKALCPFHGEKTPSFIVNPERQSWRCFGACATGGDVVSFVMGMEKVTFGEALRLLAERAGIPLAEKGDTRRHEAMYRLNKLACGFYQEALASPEGQPGMEFLRKRGVDPAAVSMFQLGLSPRGGDRLKAYFQTHGVSLDQAEEAGLLHRGDGGTRDFFWGRLMYPIHDRRGGVVGFGARALDDSMPKYLNTASTPIFDKRGTLYALHLAATHIRDQGKAVVVEGYMDAIAAHQHGYTNVVASMGTALTEAQVSRLKALATTFVLALDPDVAGREATLRSLESSWRVLERQRVTTGRSATGPFFQMERPDLRIAELPQGADPDDLIRSSPEEWERLVGQAVPYDEYMIRAIAARFDLSSADGKDQAAEALAPLITGATNAFKQEENFRKVAEALHVSHEALEASIGHPRSVGARTSRRQVATPVLKPSVSPLSGDREDFLEDYVLGLLLRRPELKEHVRTLEPDRFHKTEDREIFTGWCDCSTMDGLSTALDPALHDHLEYLLQVDLGPLDRASVEEALEQCLRRLEERYLKERQEGLLSSGDSTLPPSRELEDQVVELNTRLKELHSRRA